jgi:hypothetical protein
MACPESPKIFFRKILAHVVYPVVLNKKNTLPIVYGETWETKGVWPRRRSRAGRRLLSGSALSHLCPPVRNLAISLRRWRPLLFLSTTASH